MKSGSLRSALLLAAVSFVVYAVICFKYTPINIIGDELDYYSTLIAWAHNGSGTLTPAVVEDVRFAFPGRPMSEPRMIRAVDQTLDTEHFWFISLLTTPFYWMCQLFGLNWKYAFALLNALMFAFALGVAYRKFGIWGPLTLAAGLLSSPLLGYINRAHAEVFSVSLVAVAALCLQDGEILLAALTLSVISAQISAFSPLALLLVLIKLREFRRMRRLEWAGVAACILLLALQPVWSLWRHHVLNVLINAGYLFLDMASPKRMAEMFIDPDIGLMFTWPATVALVTLIVSGIIANRQVVARNRIFWGFTVTALVFLSFVSAQQQNYTSAAPRYSMWFISLLLVGLLVVLRDVPKMPKSLFLLSAALCLYYVAGVRGIYPSMHRSLLAERWYEWAPGVYDPGEQTFVDLTLTRQVVSGRLLFLTGRFPAHLLPEPAIWAMSNNACSKVLVLASTFDSTPVQPRLPFGCKEPLNPQRFLEFIQKQVGDGLDGRDRFVTVSSNVRQQMRMAQSH